MANLDTRSKRASSVGLLAAFVLAPPLPDGTLDQADRQHIAATYSGILASGAIPPAPAPANDFGGDRGVVLFREEKIPKPPRPQEILQPASFTITTFQDDQRFSAVIVAPDTISATFEQKQQEVAIQLSVIPIQKSVPVKPSFEPARSRIEFVSGDNDFHVEISVE